MLNCRVDLDHWKLCRNVKSLLKLFGYKLSDVVLKCCWARRWTSACLSGTMWGSAALWPVCLSLTERQTGWEKEEEEEEDDQQERTTGKTLSVCLSIMAQFTAASVLQSVFGLDWNILTTWNLVKIFMFLRGFMWIEHPTLFLAQALFPFFLGDDNHSWSCVADQYSILYTVCFQWI